MRHLMRGMRAAGLLFGLLLGFTLEAITGAASAAEPVKIGGSHALTGGNGAIGKSSQVALQIWAEEVNARGGLLGRKVELVLYDDQSNPSTVPGIYTKLLDVDKVDVLVGLGTVFTAPAMPVVMQRNRLMLAGLSLAVNDQFNYGKYFQTMPYGPDGKSSIGLGFFEIAAKLNPRPRTIALVGADIEFANNALEGARANARRFGFEIVYDNKYPPSTVDFGSILRAVQAKKPDLVFVASYPIDTSGIVRSVREVGLKATMFGGAMVGLQVSTLKAQLADNLNGIVNYELYLREPTMRFPGTEDFLTKYRARANVQGVDPLGLYVPPIQYASMQVLEQAILATGTLDNDKLAEYMHKATFKTIVGDIKFGANGEWATPRILMTQFQKVKGSDLKQYDQAGTQVILYPESLRSGDLKTPFPMQ